VTHGDANAWGDFGNVPRAVRSVLSSRQRPPPFWTSCS